MAMVSVDDLLPVLFLLRLAYSGEFASDPKAGWATLGFRNANCGWAVVMRSTKAGCTG